jgi:DNA-binding beta-propeller fold protein YncE
MGVEKRMCAVSVGMAFLVFLITGCSTTDSVKEPTFYPPKPDTPKLQYLTSFSVSTNLVPRGGAFKRFLLGEDNSNLRGIVKPYGLDVQGSKLYVCDTVVAQVHVLDFELLSWETFSPGGRGRLQKSINVAVDAEGIRYIADPLSGQVSVYSGEGKFLEGLRLEGNLKPVGLAVSSERLYIGDLNSRKVFVLDKASREVLFSIPKNPDDQQEKLFAPTNLALGPNDDLFVSDTGGFRVQQYDAEGNYLRTFGTQGQGPGQFARNKGVAVDRTGNVYIVDAASQLVQIFNPEGQLLLFFGEPGACEYPMVLPAGVTIDYENVDYFQSYAAEGFELEYVVFVSNQYGPRKVAVYGFGSMAE